MRVYDYPGFPNPLRVRVALAEKELLDQVEFVSVDVPAGEHKRPEFLLKNPGAAVPVLELDDGTYIAECTAITEYLDHLTGEPVLTGRTPKERAMAHMMQRRAEAGLLDAVGAYFHHATAGLGPEIERYQNRDWGEKSRERAHEGMVYLDRVLGTRSYLAGECFTMADITAYAGLAFADLVCLAVPEEHHHLLGWRARVAERPAVLASTMSV